jgi:hypothetical protein
LFYLIECFIQLTNKRDYVSKLKKALYGIKQAPRAWSARLDSYLQKQGLKRGSIDNNLYCKIVGNDMIIVEVYVDDIIFGRDDEKMSKDFARRMQQEFEMSLLGELNFFLGLQIIQSKRGFFIHQSNYVKDMIKRFQLEDWKPVSTPMTIGCKLSKQNESKVVDPKHHRSMIGSLLYVTTSRPDVKQAVGMVARFQAAPKESHVQAVKTIFRYLKGTIDIGLWYPSKDSFTLKSYSDADWAGCVDDRKSTSGGAFFLGESLVAWITKKQSSISLSSTEAENIATSECCTQVEWMKQTLQDIKMVFEEPTIIYCYNTSTISLSKNHVQHSKSKHIPVKYHYLRDQVENKNIKLEYVPTQEQVANIFTKPLSRDVFEYLRQILGVSPLPI